MKETFGNSRGEGVIFLHILKQKFPLWWEYGYFLELHIMKANLLVHVYLQRSM